MTRPFIHSFIQFTNVCRGPLPASPGDSAVNQGNSCPWEALVLFGEINVNKSGHHKERECCKGNPQLLRGQGEHRRARRCVTDSGEQRPVCRHRVECGAMETARTCQGPEAEAFSVGPWSSAKEASGQGGGGGMGVLLRRTLEELWIHGAPSETESPTGSYLVLPNDQPPIL